MSFNDLVDAIGRGIDLAGVLAIAGGIGLSVLFAAGRIWRRETPVYRIVRQEVGRAILLGLELLVAADIIQTVAVSPTLESVAVLSGIVLVRTFLSFSLEVELTGLWRGSADETATRMGLPQLWRRDNPVDPWRRLSVTIRAGAPCAGTSRLNVVQ